MRNLNKWVPSKYVYHNDHLEGSRKTTYVNISSRLITDIVASLYGNYIPLYAKGRLIDLGAGKAPLYGIYKDYVHNNICVDWKNSLHGLEYLDCLCNLSETLPFSSSSFNTIILSDILEHILNPEKLWDEMNRILVHDGILFANTPFFYWLHEVPFDYHRYTEYALRTCAEKAGFEILILKPIGGTPEILADIFSKHILSVPLIGKILAISIQMIVFWFIKTPIGSQISSKTSRLFPLGYFLVAVKK